MCCLEDILWGALDLNHLISSLAQALQARHVILHTDVHIGACAQRLDGAAPLPHDSPDLVLGNQQPQLGWGPLLHSLVIKHQVGQALHASFKGGTAQRATLLCRHHTQQALLQSWQLVMQHHPRTGPITDTIDGRASRPQDGPTLVSVHQDPVLNRGHPPQPLCIHAVIALKGMHQVSWQPAWERWHCCWCPALA